MLGNNKPNVSSAMQKMAQQRLLRGKSVDANLMTGYGGTNLSGSHALSAVLRGKTSNGEANDKTQKQSSNSRNTNNINITSKSNAKSSIAGNILGAL